VGFNQELQELVATAAARYRALRSLRIVTGNRGCV